MVRKHECFVEKRINPIRAVLGEADLLGMLVEEWEKRGP
jgi:hypothetical protein